LPDLQIIDFSQTNLTAVDAKALGKVLSDFKFIRELNFSDSLMPPTVAKEIADGLMRAK